ncbi:hypothetical protein [Staphylococcus nepalensis]|uniref:hypothetical protein n=1 Tax=Staphylococcus nepalensis TaxID=214473 RepID=UPI003019DBE1
MRIEYKGDRVSMSKNEYRQVMNELNQYKQAYQHCVDDLIVLRANNERLERENKKLRKANSNGWKEKDRVINNLHYLYTTLTNHIRDMKFASPYSYNYIHLVNFIKELESADGE